MLIQSQKKKKKGVEKVTYFICKISDLPF